jgi:gliding motility-associated-like protein
VYKINLQVNSTYLFESFDTICDNQTFNFRGQVFNQTGIYFDSLFTSRGCDSVYKLNLQVNQTYFFESFDTICDNQSFNFRGQTLTQPGIYFDSLLTASGCDSVYKLNLHVNPTYLFESFDTICDNQTYNFRGQILNQTGIYFDSLLTLIGCDSVYKLNLHVNPTYFFESFDTICDNQSFNFHGQLLTQPGIYFDSLVTTAGCDSIYKLNLHVNPAYLFTTYATLCDNETYLFRGRLITAPGTYYDSLVSHLGCDSVYELVLRWNPSFLFVTNADICENETYNFRGITLNQTGTYYDSLVTYLGCDSIYQLNLTVHTIDSTFIHLEMCEGETIDDPFSTMMETIDSLLAPGDYLIEYTLYNAFGCDSIIFTSLTIYPKYAYTITDTICQGTPYDLNGFNVCTDQLSGLSIHVLPLHSSHNCDSIITLKLFVFPTYHTQHEASICVGFPFTDFGFQIPVQREAGIDTFYQYYQTQHGCDSIISLILNVFEANVSVELLNENFCEVGYATLFANTQLSNVLWSTGEISPTITITEAGRYFVTATEGVCFAENTFFIEPCSLKVYIENAITPSNGDGINDYFFLKLPDNHQIKKFEVHIYDRWGNLVFSSQDCNFVWDGRVNGVLDINEVFSYRIAFTTENDYDYLYKGNITIL